MRKGPNLAKLLDPVAGASDETSGMTLVDQHANITLEVHILVMRILRKRRKKKNSNVKYNAV